MAMTPCAGIHGVPIRTQDDSGARMTPAASAGAPALSRILVRGCGGQGNRPLVMVCLEECSEVERDQPARSW